MMRSLAVFAVLLALAACNGSQTPAPAEKSESPSSEPALPASSAAASEAPSALPSEAPSMSDYAPPRLTPEAAKGEKGARNLLLSWARAVEDRRFGAAYALYGPNGAPDGRNAAAFAADFASYKTIAVALGDGEVDGAAGSLYYAVPVTLSGKTMDGALYRREGTITLRRVNDVPGAEPWKLAWHVETVEWQGR